MDLQDALRRLNEMERLHRTGAIDDRDLVEDIRGLILDIEAAIAEDS